MGMAVVTAATHFPVGLEEVKQHLRVDASDAEEDGSILGLIEAATRQAEIETGDRQIVTATWDWTLDRFPASKVFLVPKPPLQSVTSISYVDTNGDSQTLAASQYDVDTASLQGRIVEDPDVTWPSTKTGQIDAVTVRIVAGYGDANTDVPELIRLGIMNLVALWFCNREPVVAGSATIVPYTIQSMFRAENYGAYA